MILQQGKPRLPMKQPFQCRFESCLWHLLVVFEQRLLRFYITTAAKTRYFDARAPRTVVCFESLAANCLRFRSAIHSVVEPSSIHAFRRIAAKNCKNGRCNIKVTSWIPGFGAAAKIRTRRHKSVIYIKATERCVRSFPGLAVPISIDHSGDAELILLLRAPKCHHDISAIGCIDLNLVE